MIRIKTNGPMSAEFDAWRARAENARTAMLRHYEETGIAPDLNRYQPVWRDLKEDFLMKIFNGKCAFCEATVQHANFPPHAEHYRPKKQVTVDRKTINHCGYFWLACEWHNLLLVCHNCNSGHREFSGKKIGHWGKANEFPISGKRVNRPSKDPGSWIRELAAERPLLLNPYLDDPEDHIAFSALGVPYAKKRGKAKKVSKRGRATIEACHLHRESLCTARLIVAADLFTKRLHRLIETSDTIFGSPKATGKKTNFTAMNKTKFGDRTDPFSAWLGHIMPIFAKRLMKQGGLNRGKLFME